MITKKKHFKTKGYLNTLSFYMDHKPLMFRNYSQSF